MKTKNSVKTKGVYDKETDAAKLGAKLHGDRFIGTHQHPSGRWAFCFLPAESTLYSKSIKNLFHSKENLHSDSLRTLNEFYKSIIKDNLELVIEETSYLSINAQLDIIQVCLGDQCDIEHLVYPDNFIKSELPFPEEIKKKIAISDSEILLANKILKAIKFFSIFETFLKEENLQKLDILSFYLLDEESEGEFDLELIDKMSDLISEFESILETI